MSYNQLSQIDLDAPLNEPETPKEVKFKLERLISFMDTNGEYVLTIWEMDFLDNIWSGNYKLLSPRQTETIENMYNKYMEE